MTDKEINYQSMAAQVLAVLTQHRPAWEPAYPKLLPDYETLQATLAALEATGQQRSGASSKGYTAAKNQAQAAALAAALPVVRGLKALYLEGGHPGLGKAAGYTRSSLRGLRGPEQASTLASLYELAHPLAAELAAEQVTADQLEALHAATAAYKPLLAAARAQTNAGSLLRQEARRHLGILHQALARLDLRLPNLDATLPELVAAYEQARIVVNAGHGPKKGEGDLPGGGSSPA